MFGFSILCDMILSNNLFCFFFVYFIFINGKIGLLIVIVIWYIDKKFKDECLDVYNS